MDKNIYYLTSSTAGYGNISWLLTFTFFIYALLHNDAHLYQDKKYQGSYTKGMYKTLVHCNSIGILKKVFLPLGN